MSREYPMLYRFTSEGLDLFNRVMTRQAEEAALDTFNSQLVSAVANSGTFQVKEFSTAKEMAQAICPAFRDQSPQALAGDIGLWAWLTFVLIDNLFPAINGSRQTKELHRWYPAPPNDWQKAQRHLVRMPVLLYQAFGGDADHLLCGKPAILPDIREQLTGQQDMFSANFVRTGRYLYFDDNKQDVKYGAGSKGGGSPRRLRIVRKQLDVTWDMTDLPAARILDLLPTEFDRFKSVAGNA